MGRGEGDRFSRVPRHVGLIPDGNRRWAKMRGMTAAEGYAPGVEAGLKMLQQCHDLGIEEVSVYGFTQDNAKRPREQRESFSAACVCFAERALVHDIDLMVVGDAGSPVFPEELKPFAGQRMGGGSLKVNMLVNYSWKWDIEHALRMASGGNGALKKPIPDIIASSRVSRIDLVVRWGGCRRLSGFLPVQCVYADFYVVEALWPDYEREQFLDALRWYQKQEITLGG
jgi:undecaprenyl diphosphate synthase